MPRPSVNALCLFCGSRSGNDPAQSALAEDFGRFCAANKLALVYGGGGIGLMGLAARAAIAHGGRTVGVIPPASPLSNSPAASSCTEGWGKTTIKRQFGRTWAAKA